MTVSLPMTTEAAAFSAPRLQRSGLPFVSVILPVYNELAALPLLVQQLDAVLQSTDQPYELIFADDGSTDGSTAWLQRAARERDDLTVVVLSRNFGQPAALEAAMSEARGDVVVIMDSDLQDDATAIPRFLAAWQDGHDVVYAVRTQRRESWVKRGLFFGFYRVLRMLADVPIPYDAGNFSLLDRRVVQHLLALPERTRFLPGLRSWVGFRQVGIPVPRLSRYDASPRVSLWQLLRLARTAIFSFSTAPIAAFWLIAMVATGTFVMTGSVALVMSIFGDALPHMVPSLLVILFFTALNASGIAVLGEYAVRILDQVQGRPSYLVDHVVRAKSRSVQSTDRRRQVAQSVNS